MGAAAISLGEFRDKVSELKAPFLTRDEPLEPISINMPIERIHVVLGASPYVILRSGLASVCLSHIQTVKPSVKHGRKGYRILCGDYAESNVPRIIEYRIFSGE